MCLTPVPVVDMVRGGYDAAIRVGEVIERDMIAVRLGPDLRQIVVASPDYLARQKIQQTSSIIAAYAGTGPARRRPTTGSSGTANAGSR